jgi:hypothetical protein
MGSWREGKPSLPLDAELYNVAGLNPTRGRVLRNSHAVRLRLPSDSPVAPDAPVPAVYGRRNSDWSHVSTQFRAAIAFQQLRLCISTHESAPVCNFP